MRNIFLFILIGLYNPILSQNKFTPDAEKFLKEVQSFIGEYDKTKARKYVKSFEPLWFGEFFDANNKAHVYATLNTMRSKQLRLVPHFLSYFNAILYYSQNEMSIEKFENWQNVLDILLKKANSRRIEQFLKVSENLFLDGTIYLTSRSQKAATRWEVARKDNFQIKYLKKVPVFTFQDVDLKCFSKGDSSVIYNTYGDFFPLTSIWLGSKGKIDWQRANMDKNIFYANIKDYKLALKNSSYYIDSVSFYSSYFDQPIMGKLTEKVLSAISDKKRVSYPTFESYDKRLNIENVNNNKNIEFNGGFTIRGRNLYGSGSVDNLSILKLSYNNKEILTAESIRFIINEDGISSDNAKIRFNIGEDSIIHPSANLKFSENSKNLVISRGNEGISAAPFYNSYHQLDMYSQSLEWKLGDPLINFKALEGSQETRAQFASLNFFDVKTYDQLNTPYGNVLVDIKNYVKKINKKSFSAIELASYLRKSINDFQFVLFNLTELGFLVYDADRAIVSCNEKLFNYIENRSGKKDYDVLIINSDADVNARLSLSSLDLKIFGIDRVVLSLQHKVWIKPQSNAIIIKKNRDLNFDGLITAGKTQYYGSDFSFIYNDFKLNLPHCDSMFVWADYKESRKKGKLVRCLSSIQSLVGYIQIDQSDNKSGVDTSHHEYPILHSNNPTYVYYDDPTIQNGIYDREKFMFVIDPFEMDSLDEFANQGLNLNGLFKSGGIFPDFEESLIIMPDYSFGFKRNTPVDGFKIYNQLANYDNEIRLSNEGLKGTGTIEFFTSTAISEDITFFPDSVSAIAHTYLNEKRESDPEIPLVKGKDCKISYIPNDSLFYAYSLDSNFKFFDHEESDLMGELKLGFDGIIGSGVMRFGTGEVESLKYTYETDVILADTSEFRLVSLSNDLDALSFKTQNLNARVDFATRIGEFKSNSGESFVTFPENQYICYMDQFNWYMDNGELEMENSKQAAADINIDTDLDLTASNFYSIHPDQDSLNFGSSKAKFDVRKKRITCNKIPFIKVADSRIAPDSGAIVIRRKAKIDPLENAVIRTNDITKYYSIYDADVEIFTKHDYLASGIYDYLDLNGDKQNIFFSEIKPDTTDQTHGLGTIKKNKGFKLSPNYEFYGDVKLSSTIENLEFSGYTQIVHSCKNIDQKWIEFTSVINPSDIYIPIVYDSTKKYSNYENIYSGMIFNTTDSLSLYPTFVSSKTNDNHIEMINTDGFLRYNSTKKEYQISNKDKLTEYTLPGNYTALNIESCRTKSDGEFDFAIDLDQVKTNQAGEIKFNPKKWSTEFKTSTIFEFLISENAMDILSKSILDFPELRSLDFENSYYEKSLRELVGVESADKIMENLMVSGKIKKMPELLEKPIFIGDIRYKWNPNRKSYVSYGDIGIANINKKQIMKYVKGKIVISKKLTGNDLTIYLQLDKDNFYYFNYKKGLMKVYSSNEDFNKIISETKKDETKSKIKGLPDYQYMLGAAKDVAPFVATYMK
tara:strand:+ start:4809 stop:9269 length:4461 start_codon:yes stop_codon:yes gene_type:complete